jgi:hypothetical protein
MRDPQRNSDAPLVQLAENLGRLEGGTLSIGAFNSWFMSASWEARMAPDSAALRLGWRIQNLLYQWQDDPDAFTPDDFAAELRRAWAEYATSGELALR